MERISKKQILLMLLIIFCILLIYFIFSGTFNVNSSYNNVLSISKYDELAEGDDWQVYIPESNDNKLAPYFKYAGSKYPKSNIHIKAILYFKEGDSAKVEWYPYADKHFFFGEQRYYFPEDYNNLQSIACKIVWNEYKGDKDYASYIFSNNLNDAEKASSLKYIDTFDLNENDSSPKH